MLLGVVFFAVGENAMGLTERWVVKGVVLKGWG